MFGVTAALICVTMIDLFQLGIAAYLINLQKNLYGGILLLLIIPQVAFQDIYFLRDPLKNDVKYQVSAQPFLVLGMLVTGLALGHAGLNQQGSDADSIASVFIEQVKNIFISAIAS